MNVQVINRPKLYPPLALIAQVAGQGAVPAGAALAARSGTLSVVELRRIVADLID